MRYDGSSSGLLDSVEKLEDDELATRQSTENEDDSFAVRVKA
jgi:hypothetical protein